MCEPGKCWGIWLNGCIQLSGACQIDYEDLNKVSDQHSPTNKLQRCSEGEESCQHSRAHFRQFSVGSHWHVLLMFLSCRINQDTIKNYMLIFYPILEHMYEWYCFGNLEKVNALIFSFEVWSIWLEISHWQKYNVWINKYNW